MALKKPQSSHREKQIPKRNMQKQPSASGAGTRDRYTGASHPVITPDSSSGPTGTSIIIGHLPEALVEKLEPYSHEAIQERTAVIRNKAKILQRRETRNGHSRDLSIPGQVWDFKEKYARVMITISPQMFYVLDKLGVLSYNPFYRPGVFELFKNHKTISESWYCTGVAIEHIQKGKATSLALLSQQAKGCQAINQSLGSSERGLTKKWAETRAILSMSFVAMILNDGLGWHLHLKGMKQYLAVHGEGLKLNNTLSHVDIEGSIVFREPLNFAFVRHHGPIPCELPAAQVASTIKALRSLMRSCLIKEKIVEVVVAVSIFSKNLEFSRRNPPENLFDPHNLTEDFQALHYELLITPQLVWSNNRRENSSDDCVLEPLGCSLAGHPHCPDYLGKAIRITALMCLRAPTMNAVYGKLSYTSLLSCLYEQLQLVLAWLLHPPRGHAAKSDSAQHRQGVARARPVLIWICIIGYFTSKYFDIFHRGWSYRHPERSIYSRILGQLSVRSERDIEQLAETNLEIYRLLNLNWAAEKPWDGRNALKRVISGR